MTSMLATAVDPGMTATANFADLPILSRQERIDMFGIDCGDALEWKGGTWGPGGEYIKRMVVKNLSPKIQKLRYKLPATKFFSMEFPELIKLSPGTFQTIEVRFRPIRLEPYNDFVLFSTAAGKFKMPIIATLSKLAVSVPELVDFDRCPVAEITQQNFQLRNVGEIPAEFNWDVEAPFRLVPKSGTIPPGSFATIRASFAPVDASVNRSKAVVHVTGEQDSQVLDMAIHGIGKYPYISASTTEIDFGEQLVGTEGVKVTQYVDMHNHSQVHASFDIKRVEHDRDSDFVITPTTGYIPPGQTTRFTIVYHPASNGMYSCDNFDVITPGGNTVRLTCKGTARGPTVVLFRKEAPSTRKSNTMTHRSSAKTNSINFGSVKEGEMVTRVLFLQNKSNCPAVFQFMAEELGVFWFDRTQGVIPPLLQAHVVVSFKAEVPGNFYRRVFCQIRDQAPLYVDMIATAYDDKRRPAPLLQRHVDAFRNRPAAARRMGPGELDAWVERHGKFDVTDEQAEAEEGRAMVTSRSGEMDIGRVDSLVQFFENPTDPDQLVGLGEERIEFGGCTLDDVAEKKTVHVVNRTRAKLTVVWRVPGSFDDGDDEQDFFVHPESADIAPGQTLAFRVAFRPTRSSFYYCQELEAYAYPKTNRTFRLVNDASFTPPWCLSLTAWGHTFPPDSEQYMAKVSVSHGKVMFPPCHIGDCVYQTLQLTNTHDTPAAYIFKPDPTGTFTVKPAAGMIGLNSFQLITIRFRPRNVKKYRAVLTCDLNNAPENAITVRVEGAGSLPQITLENSGLTHFKSTYLGTTSTRIVKVHNTSRIPVALQWSVPARERDELALSPMTTIVRGNEVLPLKCTFAPIKAGTYSLKAACSVSATTRPGLLPPPGRVKTLQDVASWIGVQANAGQPVGHVDYDLPQPAAGVPREQRATLQALGEGTTGALHFHPPMLDFGTALVATTCTRKLVLENQSDATIFYRLNIVAADSLEVLGDDGSSDGSGPAGAGAGAGAGRGGKAQAGRQRRKSVRGPTIAVNKPEGSINARSRMTLQVTFAPGEAGVYSFRCYYDIVSTHENGLAGTAIMSSKAVGEAGVSRAAAMQAEALEPGTLAPVNSNSLWCCVNAKSGYPTLTWEDARLIGLDNRMHGTLRGESYGGTTAALDTLGGGDALGVLPRADLACIGSPWRLWKQFSLEPLNACLARPLSAKDLAFNRATQLRQKPEELETFVLDFTPAPLGTTPMRVLFNVCNTGRLHTEFSFRLPNELDIELEPWAEKGEPTDEDLAVNALIDAKIFEIEPRRGSLGPGESTTLALTYNYTSMQAAGMHQIPVILKLEKGKQVRLMLQGRTLEPTCPLLFLGNPLRSHAFAPVPIGVMEPPVQSMPLYNPSGVAVRYMVDDANLQAMTVENYNFEVLKCLNRDGFIEAGGSVMLQFVFRPLEAREYATSIDIVYTIDEDEDAGATGRQRLADTLAQVDNAETAGMATLALSGTGFCSAITAETQAVSQAVGPPGLGVGGTEGLDEEDEDNDTPSSLAAAEELKRALAVVGVPLAAKDESKVRKAAKGPVATIGSTPAGLRMVRYPSPSMPEAMATLSDEWLRLGDLPRDATVSRVVVVRNTRSQGSITYQWDSSNDLLAQRLVRIHPRSGRLAAGSHAVCKVQFTAACDPTVFHEDIACVISVPLDEVKADAEQAAKTAAADKMRKERRALRNPTKIPNTPHESVVFRTTASRQTKTRQTMSNKPMTGMTAMSGMGMSTAGGMPGGMPEGMMSNYSVRGGMQSAMSQNRGTMTPSRSGTQRSVRSVRSRLSRALNETPPVIVPPPPTTTLVLHVNARVCSQQEFLLIHSRSRLASFFVRKPEEADVAPISDATVYGAGGSDNANANAGAGAGAGVGAGAGAAATTAEGAAELQDVMAQLLQDLVQDPDVANAFDRAASDPTPLFSQLSKGDETPQVQSPRGDSKQEGNDTVSTDVRLQALRGNECQALVEKLTENTLLNVLKEASFGEFSLTQPSVMLRWS